MATAIIAFHDSDIIVVGTGLFDTEEDECTSGRVIGICIGEANEHEVLWDVICNGAVLALTEIRGSFAAAINSNVPFPG